MQDVMPIQHTGAASDIARVGGSAESRPGGAVTGN